MTFLDSSALFKRYALERGSGRVSAICTKDPRLFASKLTYAEILATLGRRRRAGQCSGEEYRDARNQFLADWERFVVADLKDTILERTLALTEALPLTGADAIQLSTALEFRQEVAPRLLFVSSDKVLLRAAREVGLATLDPEN